MPRFGKVDVPEFQFLAFEASQKGRKSLSCAVPLCRFCIPLGYWGAVGSPDHCPLGSPARTAAALGTGAVWGMMRGTNKLHLGQGISDYEISACCGKQ